MARYDPDHVRIREEIQQRLGAPLYGSAYLEEPLRVATRTFKWVEQSDPFSYVGSHWVDLIYHYYRSKPVSLTAVGQKRRLVRDGINAYDAVQVRVDFANGLSVTFNDGSKLDEVLVEYPIGHRRRRAEGIPLLEAKFRRNLARRFDDARQQAILDVALDQARLEAMPVQDFMTLLVA